MKLKHPVFKLLHFIPNNFVLSVTQGVYRYEH